MDEQLTSRKGQRDGSQENNKRMAREGAEGNGEDAREHHEGGKRGDSTTAEAGQYGLLTNYDWPNVTAAGARWLKPD